MKVQEVQEILEMKALEVIEKLVNLIRVNIEVTVKCGFYFFNIGCFSYSLSSFSLVKWVYIWVVAISLWPKSS